MPIASGPKVSLSYLVEATRGTTPAGAFTLARLTERAAPDLDVNTLQTNEVSATRQRTSVRSGFRSVSGSMGFELSRHSQDDILELLTNDTWAHFIGASVDHAVTQSVSATEPVFTFTVASTADEMLPGMIVVVNASGGGADVGLAFQVNSVNSGANSITCSALSATTLSGTTAVTSITLGQRIFTTNDDLRTFSIQRRFTDIPLYQVFTGVAINSMTISARPESLITGTLDIVGMAAGTFSGTETGGAPNNNPGPSTQAFSPFTGCVFAGGVRLAIATAFELTINNNRTTEAVLCDPYSPDVYEGVCDVTGSMTLLFQDATHYNMFLNETEVQVGIRFADSSGEWMAFSMSRVLFTGASFDVPQSGPVKMTLPFTAVQSNATVGSANTQHTLCIQRSTAAA